VSRQEINKTLSSVQTTKPTKPYRPTIADVRRWSQLLNHIMFHGHLPKWRKVQVRRLRGVYAWCEGDINGHGKKYCDLTIHQRFDSFAAFYSVLAHELCHFAEFQQLDDMQHGEFFCSHKEMLAGFGIRLNTSYKQKA
jgi:hypothetical protein